MNKKLNVLITGASRGIGLAISRVLLPKCNMMFLTAKEEKNLYSFIESYKHKNDECAIYSGAFNHAEPLEAALGIEKMIRSKTDKLDAIVLCAGMFAEGDLATISDVDFINTTNINYVVNHMIIQKALPLLKKSGFARIVIIGSTAAYGIYSEVPAYGASKWALRGYAINLRNELRKDNIGVTFISPGPTNTDMWKDSNVDKNKLLSTTDIANSVELVFRLNKQAVIDELIISPMEEIIDE